jgi:hypothetical protein
VEVPAIAWLIVICGLSGVGIIPTRSSNDFMSSSGPSFGLLMGLLFPPCVLLDTKCLLDPW